MKKPRKPKAPELDAQQISLAHKTWREVRDATQKLKNRDASELEIVLTFLSRDEYWHSSGYLKEAARKYLSRVSLSEKQKEQLRAAALGYVNTRLTREFFPMCRFICRVADQDFQTKVQHLTRSDDEAIRHRAGLLAAYFEGLEHGEKNSHKSLSLWRRHQFHVKQARKSKTHLLL